MITGNNDQGIGNQISALLYVNFSPIISSLFFYFNVNKCIKEQNFMNVFVAK